MSEDYTSEPLLEMFIFETEQNIEQLEQIIIDSEDQRAYSSDSVNEIFRIMHTIKGSAAMMSFNEISSLAHKVEDMFYFIRDIVVDIMDISIGLIVDSVSEVLSIAEQDIVPQPELCSRNNRYVRGIGKVGNDVKLLLDCEKLLSDQEMSAVEQINIETE